MARFKGRPLSKTEILVAMKSTRSNRAAARFTGVSYQFYRQFAMLYLDKETNKTLWETHKNQSGKGIPKFLKNKGEEINIKDILNGNISPSHFTPEKLRDKLIVEGYLRQECYKCGFNEHRVLDYRVPLILHFKNGKKTDWTVVNLELLCYNCYFLHIGNVFDNKQIQGLEDNCYVAKSEIDWELSDYQLEKMAELDNISDSDKNDGSEFISRL